MTKRVAFIALNILLPVIVLLSSKSGIRSRGKGTSRLGSNSIRGRGSTGISWLVPWVTGLGSSLNAFENVGGLQADVLECLERGSYSISYSHHLLKLKRKLTHKIDLIIFFSNLSLSSEVQEFSKKAIIVISILYNKLAVVLLGLLELINILIDTRQMLEDLFSSGIVLWVILAHLGSNMASGVTVSTVLDVGDFARLSKEIIGVLLQLVAHTAEPVLVLRLLAVSEMLRVIDLD
jgi:hypothetical protein